MTSKILPLQELVRELSARRSSGETMVFTNGCFDILHLGHVRYLQEARNLGSLLVVGLNSDASVRAIGKGRDRPIIPCEQRMEVLAALQCVDYVIPFDDPDPLKLIQTLRPNVLVKGGDWPLNEIIGRDTVESYGGVVQVLPMVAGISTSTIIHRIRSLSPSLPETLQREGSSLGSHPRQDSRTA